MHIHHLILIFSFHHSLLTGPYSILRVDFDTGSVNNINYIENLIILSMYLQEVPSLEAFESGLGTIK